MEVFNSEKYEYKVLYMFIQALWTMDLSIDGSTTISWKYGQLGELEFPIHAMQRLENCRDLIISGLV